jgi:predicted dehydrogenase
MQDGGTLHDLGAHVIDLVRHLWGEFEEVSARRRVFVPFRPAKAGSDELVAVTGDDAAWMMAKLRNGAVGTIETTKVATGTEDELRIELHGDKGAIKFNLMEPNWLDVYDMRRQDGAYGGDRGFLRVAACSRGASATVIPPPRGVAGWMQFHLASLHAFVQNVLTGVTGRPNFYDGWAAHEVFAAAEESNRTGSWEAVQQVENPINDEVAKR